jgi:hypothetical protein
LKDFLRNSAKIAGKSQTLSESNSSGPAGAVAPQWLQALDSEERQSNGSSGNPSNFHFLC